jgi:hypothetical protein
VPATGTTTTTILAAAGATVSPEAGEGVSLPITGWAAGRLLIGAALLVLTGGLTLMTVRRRRRS